MSFIDSIKSLFSGSAEVKVSELLDGIIEKVKPLLEQGKLGDAVKNAIGDYGDLGEKLKAIVAKISAATGDAKNDLVSDKNKIVSSIKEKGGSLVDALKAESGIPEAIKPLIEKVEALIKKL